MILSNIYSELSREDYKTILCLLKLKGEELRDTQDYLPYIDIIPTVSGGISILFDFKKPKQNHYRVYIEKTTEEILEIIMEANPIEVYFVPAPIPTK